MGVSNDANVACDVMVASDLEEYTKRISSNATYQDLLGEKIYLRQGAA